MNHQLISVIRTQGINPIIHSIDRSIRDLKQAGYIHGEIKETINDIFKGLDNNIDSYIISKGY
jgi:hypothetical protein